MLRVVGDDGLGPLLPAHHAHHLAAELLARGAVQEEVDGVVQVHQHLGHGEDQLELAHAGQVVGLAVPEGRGDDADIHGQRGDEKGEGDGQQHHRQPDVAVAGEAPVALTPSSAGPRRPGGDSAVEAAEFPAGRRPGHLQAVRGGGFVVVVVVVVVAAAATAAAAAAVDVADAVGGAVAPAAAAATAADVAAVDAAAAGAAGEVDKLVLAAALAAALLDGRALEGAAVLKDHPPARRPHHVHDNEDVEDEDDDEGAHAVEKGVHPGPDGGDEELVALLAVALRAVALAAYRHLPRYAGRPQEVQVDDDEDGRQGQHHPLRSRHVAHLRWGCGEWGLGVRGSVVSKRCEKVGW